MGRLKVYLNWANTVLQETGQKIQEISDIQHGRVLCQLIDNLDSTASLQQKLQSDGSDTPKDYVTAALDHMHKNGIKFSFSVQDILDKDVKSMLDALWQIILNYCIHPIGRASQQRSVGIGKKYILEWCQRQLSADFDSRNTLAYNLCTGDWFIKLLRKHSGIQESTHEDKADVVRELLEAVDTRHHVRQDLVNPSEVVDGTIDEHTLMIYISLLQRKVDDECFQINGATPGQQTGIYIRPYGSNALTSGDINFSQETGKQNNQEQLSSEEEEECTALSGSASPTSAHSFGSPKQDSTLDHNRKINIRLQRPRSHRLIMAEAKEKLEAEHRRREQEEEDKQRKEKLEELTHRLEEGTRKGSKLDKQIRDESVEEVGVGNFSGTGGPLPIFSALPPQFVPGLGKGVPIFVMQGQGPETMMLLQALRQARHEANFHDPHSNGTLLEQSIPKLDSLLDLEAVDDKSPSLRPAAELVNGDVRQSSRECSPRREFPRKESPRKESPRRESPRRESPRRESSRRESPRRDSPARSPQRHSPVRSPNRSPDRESYSPSCSPEFQHNKRGILEVVNDPLALTTDGSGSESDIQFRKFPRVDITKPLKEKIKQDIEEGGPEKRRERSKSPKDRDRSKSPREHKTLQMGNEMFTESSARSDDSEETNPKSILIKRERSSSTPERSYRYHSPPRDKSPRNRSPDLDISRSPYNDSARSPPYRRGSPERSSLERSHRERSPGYYRDRYAEDLSSSGKSLSDLDLEDRESRETSPGRHLQDSDPNRRLVRVLSRELELLRLKMDVVQKANMSDDTDIEDIDKVTQKISEIVKDSLSKTTIRRKSPEPTSSRISSDYDKGRMFRKRADNTSPEPRSKSENRPIKSYSPETSPERSAAKSYSMYDLSVDSAITEAADGKMTFSPTRRGRPISLGYTSPIRKVTEEIWGSNSSEQDSLDRSRLDKWKKLSKKRSVNEQEVVELKHALASVVSENDILQAKLKNSNVEINEKMSKTNDVLNDCRSHLGKSQAENMELRTQLEKERNRNEVLEERIREIDKSLQASKSSNDDLEAELEQVRGMLNGVSKKDLPTIQGMMEERENLLQVLASRQKENTNLIQDFEHGKKQYLKSQNTVNDLRKILDEALQERRQLYEEIQRLQEEGHMSQVSGIIAKYMDKGLYDDRTNGYVRSRPSSSARSSPIPFERSISPFCTNPETVESIRAKFQEVPVMVSTPNKSTSFNSSGKPSRSRPVSPLDDILRDDAYNYEDISPLVPSHFREIYPHRKTRAYRSKLPDDGHRSPSDFLDDMEVQKLMSQQAVARLDFDRDLEESFQRSQRKGFHHSRSPSRSKSPGALKMSDLQGQRPVRRQANYSPFNSTPVAAGNRYQGSSYEVDNIDHSPIDNRCQEGAVSPRIEDVDIHENNKIYLKALNNAVQGENGRRCYDDFDIPKRLSTKSTINDVVFSASYGPSNSQLRQARSQSPNFKGILKNTKSEHNQNIKDSSSARQPRSYFSHSTSPSRSPRSLSPSHISPMAESKGYKRSSSGNKKQSYTGGKPLFSTAPQRQGIVRNPNQLFNADGSLSPSYSSSIPSRLQYKHDPLSPSLRLSCVK